MILPLCGLAALTVVTAANAYVQIAAAPEMRGRVMALYMAIFMGGTPVGAPLLGWIAEHFGARWTLVGGGALTALGTIAATAWLARRQGVRITPHLLPRPGVTIGHAETAETADIGAAA